VRRTWDRVCGEGEGPGGDRSGRRLHDEAAGDDGDRRLNGNGLCEEIVTIPALPDPRAFATLAWRASRGPY
jgi:hypothetical protein